MRCGAASPSGTPSRTRTSVDALCRDAAGAGATVTSQPQDKGFGYSGVFADPDGHTWEVAWIEALVRHDDGTVALPS